MDSRNRKIEIQIRGIFALILSLNLEQVEEIYHIEMPLFLFAELSYSTLSTTQPIH